MPRLQIRERCKCGAELDIAVPMYGPLGAQETVDAMWDDVDDWRRRHSAKCAYMLPVVDTDTDATEHPE